MSALTFPCGAAEVAVGPDGTVTATLPGAAPTLLVTGGLLVHAADGRPLLPGPPEVRADEDEVELAWSTGALTLVVRHTFAVGWGLRVALSAGGEQAIDLRDPLLTWRTPDDRPAWALAAGAAGSYAVLPADGAGPLLGGVLRSGALPAVDPAGLHLGPVRLAAGARYVVQWQWDLHPGPRGLSRGRHPQVPRRLDLAVDEVVVVEATEDEALVLPDGLEAEHARGQVELSGVQPGRYPVELRAARGTTAYELRVGPPLETLLADRALVALEQPRTAAGIVRLADGDAALAVQRALAAAVLPDTELAEEALDLHTARLPDGDALDPRTVGYLCGEHTRTGDPALLERAERAVLVAASPEPGLGLAATQLCLALLLAGRPVAPVLQHLAGLAAAADRRASAAPLVAQASLLELEVVTTARRGPADGAAGSVRVRERVAALGGWLGAGLTGRAVRPLPVDQLAHLCAVLALLPEPAAAVHRTRWGCTAHVLAAGGRVSVLERVAWDGGPEAGPALSWLLLGTRAD
ncbi:hypothetical protein [Friedmanniella luteola]|uniref:hypothetical protein n=1 Tax=Friedmanniella luteola TaxID=546871 RepID=UPI000B83D829|nr:hypothetical protein [Friedmanniella luteola]